MAGLNLNFDAISENVSRLSTRLQESISERAREFSLANGLAPSFLDVTEDRVKNIRKQLDSNSNREKHEGLKTLIALVSKGRNVSEYFPQVVKLVVSRDLEIRKLVYIYLLRYATVEPDLALLSINTFQKDLADSNPLIRCMALRVLSGMNVPMISNIVLVSIEKSAKDSNPYVRKAAALALVKCYNVDSSQQETLINVLRSLLQDISPLPLGSIAVAFKAICPTRLDLLHQHYRRWCRMLVDADEWGQIEILDMLSIYARSMLSKPVPGTEEKPEEVDPDLRLLLDCAEPLFMSRNPGVTLAVSRLYYYLAPETERSILVNPVLRLLSLSREIERVVLAYLVVMAGESPSLYSSHYTRFLVRSSDIPAVKKTKISILENLFTTENHLALLREMTDYTTDPDEEFGDAAVHAIGKCVQIVPESLKQALSILFVLIDHESDTIVAAVVHVLRLIVEESMYKKLYKNKRPDKQDIKILAQMAGRIERIKHPDARMNILWVLGQYCRVDAEHKPDHPSGVAALAPDTLRLVVKNYANEEPFVRMQCITTAAKLLVLFPAHPILRLLTRYVFDLGLFDPNYDVQDRARFMEGLLPDAVPDYLPSEYSVRRVEENEPRVILRLDQVKFILFNGKVPVTMKDAVGDALVIKLPDRDPNADPVIEGWCDWSNVPPRPDWLPPENPVLGSAEVVLQRTLGLGSRRLPDWPEEGTDPSLRDVIEEEEVQVVPLYSPSLSSDVLGSPTYEAPTATTSARGSTPVPGGMTGDKNDFTDLDKFYEDVDDEESEHNEYSDDDEDDDDDGDDDEEEESEEEGEESEDEGDGGLGRDGAPSWDDRGAPIREPTDRAKGKQPVAPPDTEEEKDESDEEVDSERSK